MIVLIINGVLVSESGDVGGETRAAPNEFKIQSTLFVRELLEDAPEHLYFLMILINLNVFCF